MSDLDVTIERPICTAAICDNTGRQVAPVEIESAVDLELIELKDQLCRQRVDFTRAAELLDKACTQVQQHYEQALGRYAQQLTHLAVQIARKILWSKVEQGDYEIEKIVTQLLQAADSNGQNVTVRLNPADIAGCEKMLEPMDNCRFIADENVAKAECVVETEGALVESRIEQGLARIEKSLQKAN